MGPDPDPSFYHHPSTRREAFALLSSSHPLAPSDLVGDIRKQADLKAQKEKGRRRGEVTFKWLPLPAAAHPATKDKEGGIGLHHWVKCYKDASGNAVPADRDLAKGEYPFAKFNTKAPVYRCVGDEWETLIAQDEDWTKEESERLIDLAEALDFKWLVVHDRYEVGASLLCGMC